MTTRFLNTEVARAKALSKCALAAYEPATYEMQKLVSDWSSDFNDVRPVFQENAQAAVFSHDKFYAVAIRGTDQMQDWLDNIRVGMDELHLHPMGFSHHANLLKYPLMDALGSLVKQEGRKPVWFTGHSLGGACATILGLEYALSGNGYEGDYGMTAGIATFGAPRCMTKAAVEWSKSVPFQMWRFRHRNDIVPRIPKSYKHPSSAELVYIDRRDRICVDSTWPYRLQDRAADFTLCSLVGDHPMKHYDHAVQSWNRK